MRERRRRRRRPRSSTSPSRVLSGARGRKSSRAAALPRYVRETLNQIIADYTGQMQSKVEDDCDRDFFMTPEEAVECVARSRRAAPRARARARAPSLIARRSQLRNHRLGHRHEDLRDPQAADAAAAGCCVERRARLQFWCVGDLGRRRVRVCTHGGHSLPVIKNPHGGGAAGPGQVGRKDPWTRGHADRVPSRRRPRHRSGWWKCDLEARRRARHGQAARARTWRQQAARAREQRDAEEGHAAVMRHVCVRVGVEASSRRMSDCVRS